MIVALSMQEKTAVLKPKATVQLASEVNSERLSDDIFHVSEFSQPLEYMKSKHWILVAVVAALVAWAGVETQRLCAVRKQLAASRELQRATSQRVELVRLKYAQ